MSRLSRPRPRTRGDAARNRDLLLRAAGQLVAAHGTAVPLDEIARTAGLSSGTLYRNFASREDLFRGLYDEVVDRMDALVARVERAPTGWDGIVTYVDGVLEVAYERPEITQVMVYMRANDPDYRRGDHWVAPAQELVARAHREGSLRLDATATDVTYVPHLLVRLMQWPEPQRGLMIARMRSLVLDSLRRRDGQEPLPLEPLSVDGLRAAAYSWT